MAMSSSRIGSCKFVRSKKTKNTPNLDKFQRRHATHRLAFTNYAHHTEGRHMIGNIVQEAFLDRGIRLIMMGASVPDAALLLGSGASNILGPVAEKLQIINFPYTYSMAQVREESDKGQGSIHEYIQQKDTIDAYTWLVLDAYQQATPSRQVDYGPHH